MIRRNENEERIEMNEQIMESPRNLASYDITILTLIALVQDIKPRNADTSTLMTVVRDENPRNV